jgi:guanylate kinase
MNSKNKSAIIIISGPTGVGESTLTRRLLKIFSGSRRLITTTSREKRPSEKSGRDYFFISKKQFETKIKNHKFFEYTYIKNRDVYYGTKKSDYTGPLSQNKILFVNCDAVGLNAIKKEFKIPVVSIFINYEKISDIKNRLKTRNPNISSIELNARLNNAKAEVNEKKYYDYVVVNRQGQIEKTLTRIEMIIRRQLELAKA